MIVKKKFGFTCEHCGAWVSKDQFIGTHFRNHCPFCLYSKHLDEGHSGDRQSGCRGLMAPVGLTFKKEGQDQYGRPHQGELMLIHYCQACLDFSINRLAADDNVEVVITIFKESLKLNKEILEKLKKENIRLLDEKDENEINTQLFGKKI